jgi:hypothetical protein
MSTQRFWMRVLFLQIHKSLTCWHPLALKIFLEEFRIVIEAEIYMTLKILILPKIYCPTWVYTLYTAIQWIRPYSGYPSNISVRPRLVHTLKYEWQCVEV